jgi:hypothetical protein
MRRFSRFAFLSTATVICLALLTNTAFSADGAQEFKGWEVDGAYNKLYKSSERDQIKGVVEDVEEVVPMAGMTPGIAIVIRDQDEKELNVVHLGPKGFVNLDGMGLKKGDKVKVRGVWAEVDGKDVFMACKVKKGEYSEIKVRRTSDGRPFWAMTKEELEKEKSESE